MKYLRLVIPKTEVNQVLIMSSIFSMALITFRISYPGFPMFVFLVWKLFLAGIPYLISTWMGKHIQERNELVFFISFIIWLLFIPNSFYIITDLFHLHQRESVPLWYDLALLFSFAWSGLLYGIVSVRQMEKIFEGYFSKRFDLLFIVPVMFLNSLGVYVGRYLRFNSWDVIANPFQLAGDITYLFLHPVQNRLDWSMITCYTLLMTLIYTAIKKLSKVL